MTSRPLRLALMINLAPRKLGSFERWVVALAAEAVRRGHHMDVYGHEPVHEIVADQLAAVGARLLPAAELTRHPVRAVRHLARSYDVLHLNLFAPRGAIARIAYGAWPARVLFVDRVSGSRVDGEPEPSLASRVLDRVTLVRAAGLTGISTYVRERAAARFNLPAHRVRTIYNGADTQRFRPPDVPRPGGVVRVLAVANLIPAKGVHHLLQAVAAMREPVRLRIAGDGPEEARLRDLACELGIADRTEFLGLRDDVPELLREAHIVVHPAVWAEAFGMTVVEAMASECAVIASRAGATPELIEEGVSGLLVAPGDERALAAALDALARDPARRAAMGRAARERVLQHFDLADCVRRHVEWCEWAGASVRRRPA